MKIKETKDLYNSDWLSLKETTYLDKKGQEQKWQFTSRKNKQNVVLVICRSKRYNKFLFISQPRPPIKKVEIDFPAGLIDKGETPEKAALRELEEETGYKGEVIRVSPLCVKSAGLSDESTFMVECIVDASKRGKSKMEDTEDIKIMWKTPLQFLSYMKGIDSKTTTVSSNAYNYILGYVNARGSFRKK